MQSVLVACDGDMAKAKGWLIDMDPFVAEGNELPTQLQAMYAEGTSDMQSTEELPDASNDNNSVSSTEDVYWKHRKAAIRLSRQWRKLFRKYDACSLFSLSRATLTCTPEGLFPVDWW